MKKKYSFYLYILESIVCGRYYIGVSDNVSRRIDEHNRGLSKSTAPYKPYVVRRVEGFETIEEAYKRERFLKLKKSRTIIRRIVDSSPDVLAEQEAGIPISR